MILADKLYWISAQRPPQSDYNAYFFNVDNVSEDSLERSSALTESLQGQLASDFSPCLVMLTGSDRWCVQELVYEPFNSDFGPLNLANTHKFIRELCRVLADERFKDVKLFHYCSNMFDKQANAAYLMGAFMVVILKQPAEVAWEAFAPY